MDLQEMLEHTAKVYLDDRTELVSGASDNLFADASLVTFMNKGADEFARRTWRLQSQYSVPSAAWTSVTLATGVKDYALHSRVIRVLSVKLSDSDLDLRLIGYNDSRPVASPMTGYPLDYFDINSPFIETPGRPSWYALDVGVRTIRFRATPSSVENGLVAQMRVVNMPIVQLSADDLDAVCEIEPDYHELICMYAAGRALTASNVDSDASATGRGYLQDFYAQCRVARNDLVTQTQSMPRYRFGGWVRGSC